MKKAFAAFLMAAVLVTANGVTTPADAATNVNVMFEGEVQQYDQPATVINGRTMVPLRAIFEKLDANVQWDGTTQTITATRKSLTLVLKVGSTTATKKYASGSSKSVTLDQAAVIVNGRTLVPLRFVSEAFNAGVEWDAATNTAKIKKYRELTLAAEYNDLAYLKQQAAAGVDLNYKNSRNASVLAQATAAGSVEMVNYLIEQGVEVNTQDVDGDTPLMYAAGLGRLEHVQALLDSGKVDLNVRNKAGQTALGLAKQYKRTDVANLLSGAGATE